MIKGQADFGALKELVLVDVVPMLTRYYTEVYQPGCCIGAGGGGLKQLDTQFVSDTNSSADTRVSELLFDALEKLVTLKLLINTSLKYLSVLKHLTVGTKASNELKTQVTAGNLGAEDEEAVSALVAAIGDKVESRRNRRNLLQFTIVPSTAARAPGGGGGGGGRALLTSPSGKMDAPSLLRDLMMTGARALKLQER